MWEATYNKEAVKAQLRAGEKILFIVLFGYPVDKTRFLAKMMTKMVHTKKMHPTQFFEPQDMLNNALELFPMLNTGLRQWRVLHHRSTNAPHACL